MPQIKSPRVFISQFKPGIERVQALADIFCLVLCCHSNETRSPIANLPNGTQLDGTPGPLPFPKLYPGLCSSVGMRQGTDRQTHRCTWPIYISHRLRLARNNYTIRIGICSLLIHCSIWATVCKTVHPMLSVRCLSCLSVLSVTLVYCGQTVWRIKMKICT